MQLENDRNFQVLHVGTIRFVDFQQKTNRNELYRLTKHDLGATQRGHGSREAQRGHLDEEGHARICQCQGTSWRDLFLIVSFIICRSHVCMLTNL